MAGARGGRSLLELPFLPAHGAVLLHLLRVEPLQDAVHVEAVRALAPHQRAVVAGHLACTGQGQGQGHGGLTDSPGLARPRLRKAWGGGRSSSGRPVAGAARLPAPGHVTCDARRLHCHCHVAVPAEDTHTAARTLPSVPSLL